jgi:hypothetical protein
MAVPTGIYTNCLWYSGEIVAGVLSHDGKGEATDRNKQRVGSTEKIDQIILHLVHSNSTLLVHLELQQFCDDFVDPWVLYQMIEPGPAVFWAHWMHGLMEGPESSRFFLNQVKLRCSCCVVLMNPISPDCSRVVGITKCVLPTEGQLIDTRENPPPPIMLARLLSGG